MAARSPTEPTEPTPIPGEPPIPKKPPVKEPKVTPLDEDKHIEDGIEVNET
jgi:hypothetical protein